jgi:S1-C subfamily serine protease
MTSFSDPSSPVSLHDSLRQGKPVNSWLVLVLLALNVVLLYLFVSGRDKPLHDSNAVSRTITPRGDLSEDEKSTIKLFKNATGSVVHVTNLSVRRDVGSDDFFKIPQGTGSGFLWDNEGHVVTNYHVIRGAQAVVVTLADNSPWDARLVGFDELKDLAVLKIDAPQELLVKIAIGKSSDLQVGQKVFAIGNPFGLDHTLTVGYISGLNREFPAVDGKPIQGVIQTDAAINPGNSGGPLLDSAGKLIGVNTAVMNAQGATGGIGFAIPVDIVNQVAPDLIRYGKVVQPGLGIYPMHDSVVMNLRLRGKIDREGVLVLSVHPGGAAEKAGIIPTSRNRLGARVWGDLIVSIDGDPIENRTDLFKILDRRRVGEVVVVGILRNGKLIRIKLTLAGLPTEEP